MPQEEYPNQDFMPRIARLKLADDLIGKQLWLTHYWKGKYWLELSEPISRTVQQVIVQKDRSIVLSFSDGVVPVRQYGETIFNTKTRAKSELAYLNRRNQD